jgi:hypothetical protein
VLTEEQTSCASEALQALFAAKAVKACRPAPPPASLRPPPLPPVRLALVSPAKGYSGLPGRTLHAVALTLADLSRQLSLQAALSGSPEGLIVAPRLRTGGLRAGWAQYAGGTVSLHGYSYVPGMTVSGSINTETEDLQVGGSTSAHGTLRLGPHRSLVGALGGRHVVLPASPSAAAAIVGGHAQASSHPSSGGSGAHAAAGRLAELLGRIEP